MVSLRLLAALMFAGTSMPREQQFYLGKFIAAPDVSCDGFGNMVHAATLC